MSGDGRRRAVGILELIRDLVHDLLGCEAFDPGCGNGGKHRVCHRASSDEAVRTVHDAAIGRRAIFVLDAHIVVVDGVFGSRDGTSNSFLLHGGVIVRQWRELDRHSLRVCGWGEGEKEQ